MKSNLDKYVQQVISGFQMNKGRASVYCFPPIDFAELVINILNQFYTRSPGAQVFIAVDGFKTRKAILDKIAEQQGVEYNVKVLSADYIKPNYKYDYRLIITVGVNDNLELIKFLSEQGKFILAVLTKNIMDTEFITNVRELLPGIEVTISNAAVRSDSIYSPVEEYRVAVGLDDDDKLEYEKCSEYISTSVSIFGDISNIEKCKMGDINNNISAAEYRELIAKENGWSTELDTSIEWSKRIDDVYNPNILLERSNNFYNITKKRRDLVTDNYQKLFEIAKICIDNSDKKILIVSKRGEFAATITKYLNESNVISCGDYHDCIDDQPALDIYGVPILVKSGKDKGKQKIIKAQAISTANMSHFNNSMINALSIKNKSDIKLEIAIDLVIFTSPLVDDIIAFKTRFNNVKFNSVPTRTYKIYCMGTIEHNYLLKNEVSPIITVIDNNDEDFIGFNETNGNYII